MFDRAERIECVEDALALAKRRVPPALFEQYDAGTGIGTSLNLNEEAFRQVVFRPRAGVSVQNRDLSTSVLGFEISMPVLAAPIGLLRLGHSDGEVGVARACGTAGTIQVVSSATGHPIEAITGAASGPIFYQLFFFGDRAVTTDVIERVKSAGCQALVVTIDSAAPAGPEVTHRQRRRTPTSKQWPDVLRSLPSFVTRPSWLYDFLRDGRPLELAMAVKSDGELMSVYEALPATYQQTPSWTDLEWIRELWLGPLVIKGIVRPDDARRAVELGADAIVVSNHGGKSLDGTVPSLRVLPEIVSAVGDAAEILLDSGVRRGSDVLKALSLGARAVLIGRPYLYGHLAAGQLGVSKILEVFRTQIDQGLALLGCDSVAALDSTLVSVPADW